jgi:hypothetical protein
MWNYDDLINGENIFDDLDMDEYKFSQKKQAEIEEKTDENMHDQYRFMEYMRQENIKFQESIDRQFGKITPKCYCFVGEYITVGKIMYPTKLSITDLNNREHELLLHPNLDFEDINYYKLLACESDDTCGLDELIEGEKHVINLPHKKYEIIQIIYDRHELILKVNGSIIINMNHTFQYYLPTIKGLLKSFLIYHKK